MRSKLTAFAILTGLALAATGCDGGVDAYPVGPEVARVSDPATRTKISESLEKLYGTPRELRAPHGSGIEMARVTLGREVYRGLCLHCHGEFGDGAGPAAMGMNPLPRDFRKGTFKFTSTRGGEKPTRDDLVATLRRGMPLAKMPSFAALEQDKLDWVVEYVVFLAQRGEVEQRLGAVAQNGDDIDDSVTADVVASIAASWSAATSAVVTPAAPMPPLNAQTLARGREIFQSNAVKCASCHGVDGKGNGPSAAGLKDDWNQLIQPRDLTLGVYRGGSRPIDIFRTICCGVKGTPMPAFGGTVPPEDIWALALYVRSLGAEESPVW